MSTPQTIAVLTGDLINSTALGPAGIDRAMEALRDAAQTVEGWGICGPLHFTRHRGDGWQIVVDDPRYALRVAVMLRATLRAIEADTYIGIAEGPVDHPVGPNLNIENAAVFATSGRALEIAKTSDYAITHSRQAAQGMAILLNRICTEWTTVQAATIAAAIDAPNNDLRVTDIAERLGKSRQSVTKSLQSAWYWEITDALLHLENSYDD